ncbi:MAG: sterol desaturase family protein [Pseudomonadales bacterium]|nr:sterol desaturase family protein [Pseudomonadales bacterium]
MGIDQAFETILRLGIFLSVLITIAVLEVIYPRRIMRIPKGLRWRANIGISIVNQLLTRLIMPLSATALAILCAERGWGLLHQFTLPSIFEFVGAIVCLDLIIYWQHRLYHLIPVLWRFHCMHHTDTEFDVTTGIRFHPVSILLSAFIKLGAVLLLGPSALAVAVFEILLNATSLFNHSNLSLPVTFDQRVRGLLVTPDMHRVHHSIRPDEQNHNFGFNFPWWDHLFGSYQAQPSEAHTDACIGLDQFRGSSEVRIRKLLTQPFRTT